MPPHRTVHPPLRKAEDRRDRSCVLLPRELRGKLCLNCGAHVLGLLSRLTLSSFFAATPAFSGSFDSLNRRLIRERVYDILTNCGQLLFAWATIREILGGASCVVEGTSHIDFRAPRIGMCCGDSLRCEALLSGSLNKVITNTRDTLYVRGWFL